VTRLNRNQVGEILRLVSCENFICKRKEFIFIIIYYIYHNLCFYKTTNRHNEPLCRSTSRAQDTPSSHKHAHSIKYSFIHISKSHSQDRRTVTQPESLKCHNSNSWYSTLYENAFSALPQFNY